MNKPELKPECPFFSSGPCAKRPGWSLDNLQEACLGRSHRSAEGKKKLKDVIERSKTILGMPDDYHLAIVPASDTGAVEMALWSLLGARGVDIFAWESFGKDWLKDVTTQLNLDDVRCFEADYGRLPDLGEYDPVRDCVFTWNGTTSGVRVPNGDWISDDRTGLTICDATSAVFAYDLSWNKLDVVTWSWQKVLGGEAAHGMLALSPRAVERLENYIPPWPMPKLFRMTKGGVLNESVFQGATINTPSMLAVEDCLDALNWVERIGGLSATIARAQSNFDVIDNFVAIHDWVDFLAVEPSARSITSVCLTLNDRDSEQIKAMVKKLDSENVAYDIAAYRDAPPGLRIWCGATVDAEDIQILMPWLEWAYNSV